MMNRQYFIRSSAAVDPGTLDQYGMSGLFSKLVKAVAKPFTKVFKPKTLLGKLADPLGLMSRNINLTGRIADVVGTAATLAVGAYAVGAATGATGGFWATAGAGAKTAALKLGSGLASAGKGVAAIAAGAAKAMGPTAAALMAGGGMQQPAAGMTPMVTEAGSYGDLSTMGAAAAWDAAGGTLSPLGTNGGGGGAGSMMPGDDMPGAVVPVEDTMPEDGPNWLLLGGIALGAAVLIMSSKKKARRQ